MDELIKKIAAFGVPGIILIVAVNVSGFAGAAALTTALAALGGPVGMVGGIAMLGVIGMISHGLSSYGFEKILNASIDAEMNRARGTGKSRSQIVREAEEKIDRMVVSRSMKLKLKDSLRAGVA